MPGKSKAADTAMPVNEDAIRQRAYFLWEKDGRQMGRDDHYWQLAHQQATEALVDGTATRTARITKGKNPAEIPPDVLAGNKSAKATVKAAESGKAAKVAKAKPVRTAEAKTPKKAVPKPRAAIQKMD
jgi:hypothetical protein